MYSPIKALPTQSVSSDDSEELGVSDESLFEDEADDEAGVELDTLELIDEIGSADEIVSADELAPLDSIDCAEDSVSEEARELEPVSVAQPARIIAPKALRSRILPVNFFIKDPPFVVV